jgi:hypothetical protein
MADSTSENVLKNISRATQNQIAQNAKETLDANGLSVGGNQTATTKPVTTPPTNTTQPQTPVVEPPKPVTTTPTPTTAAPTSQTTTLQGDQSTTATVTTPNVPVSSGTTGVSTTTPTVGVSTAMSNELYTSNPVFNDYASKSGYAIQNIDGKVYVNNSLVDWQKIGMRLEGGKLYGTKAQYDQLLNQVKKNGFTTGQTFSEFAVDSGYKVNRSTDGKFVIINGIPVDPSQYDGMTKLNGNWVGTAESYQNMISEAMTPRKADPDFLASTEFADYARAKGFEVGADSNGYSLNIKRPGMSDYVAHTEYYPSLKLVNGKVVGNESDYRQMLVDAQIYASVDLNSYLWMNGVNIRSNADGYLEVQPRGSKSWRAVHAPYWTDMDGGIKFDRFTSTWVASQDVYDKIFAEVSSRSDYSLDDFAVSLGYEVGKDKYGNMTIAGKSIAGTSRTGTYDVNKPTYYGDVYLIDGKYVGSENAYRKIITDLVSRAGEDFAAYANKSGSTVTVMNNKVYINGNLVDISNSSIQVVNGEVWGNYADYKKLIDKANKAYEYKSPYDAQIQIALDEIKNFETYQTPQETLDKINQLMESSKEKFNYDPSQDSALKTAQKEAERVVRESAGTKGMLYSSGTIATTARKAGELIPTYEQQAYNRWSDQKNRESQLLSTIMDWDEMQSQRNVDQLNLVKTKFDTIMDMDTRTLEQFRVMLDQKNADRSAALELQSLDLEMQQQALDIAWRRTEALGYVDEQASIVLGVPIGTKATWVQQIALEHQNALNELAQNNEYQKALQFSQKNIEIGLIQYRNALDDATQSRVLATQYANDKALAAQQYQNNLAIARMG